MNDEYSPLAALQRSAFSVQRFVVRWLFERLYHEFAWAYDTVAAAVSGGAWRSWSLSAQQFASGTTLELGCGTGRLQHALLAHPNVTPLGLDRSPQMLRQARRWAGSGARLIQADACALPLPPASVDALIATFPSEYIAAAGAISEIRRVLRPSGTVAIALWAQMDGDSLYVRLLDLAYRVTLQRSPRASHPQPDPTHVPAPLPAAQVRLAQALAVAGFHVTHASLPARCGRVHYVVGTL
jgi:SAM-dependent methyltransferase